MLAEALSQQLFAASTAVSNDTCLAAQTSKAAEVAGEFIEMVKNTATSATVAATQRKTTEQAFRSFFDGWSVTIEVLQDLATLFGTAWDSKALASDLKGPGKRIAMEGKWITAFEDRYHEHIPGCYKVLQHGRESGSNGAGGGRERRQGRNKN